VAYCLFHKVEVSLDYGDTLNLIGYPREEDHPRIQRATGAETRSSVSEKHVALHNIQESTYAICIRD
jgi:hypothetical protein